MARCRSQSWSSRSPLPRAAPLAGVLIALLLGLVFPLVTVAAPVVTQATVPSPTPCQPGWISADCPATGAVAALTPEQQLVQRYAPIMELKQQTESCGDMGEPYLPAPVDVVLNDPQVVLRQDTGGSNAAKDPVLKRGPSAAALADKGSADYLDLPGDALEPGCAYEQFSKERMTGRQPAIYAHVVVEPNDGVFVQYWFYYVYNRFNNLHESDWEMIQLRFAVDTVPEALALNHPDQLAYAQHGGGELAEWNDPKVHKDGTHPIVYPAAGSHASQYDSDVYLGWGEHGSGLGCDDSSGPSFQVVPEVLLIPDHPSPTGPFAWATFKGRWGEKGRSPFDGPTGPNMKSQWTDPYGWEQGLRQSSLPIGHTKSFGPNPTGVFCGAVSFGAGLLVNQAHYAWYTYSVVALLLIVPLIFFLIARQILGEAIALFIRHAFTFLAIGAVLVIVGAVASYIDDALSAIPIAGELVTTLLGLITPGQFLFFQSGTGLADFLGWTFVTPAVIYVVASIQTGRLPGVREAYRVAATRFWTLIRAAARVIIVTVLLFISIVGIPWGVVKLVRWSLVTEAVVLDDAKWNQAGKVSERSVVGRWWRTAVVLVVISFLVTAIAPVAGIVILIFVHPSVFLANAISGVVYALTFPLAGIVTALWYLRRPGGATQPTPAKAKGKMRGVRTGTLLPGKQPVS